MSCGPKNQTSESTLKLLSELSKEKGKDFAQNEKGTGLFLVPAPELPDILATRVILVPNLSYNECAARGQSCLAFKWVADKQKSFKELDEARSNIRCSGFCRAPIDCELHCMCDTYIYECR